MEELLRSLALFKPEIALVAGLLLVVIADSIGAAWRNAAVRLLTLASLAVALGLAFNLQASGAQGLDLLRDAGRGPARGGLQGRPGRGRRS